MNRGILIFAYNSRDVDYALMALISGGLAKKHLELPVSLVTDQSTVDWMKQSNIYERCVSVFDKIILTDRPIYNNTRNLHDGASQKTVPFINFNRSDAYSLTPYDQTLLIDSDFLIFSNNLNAYWEYSERVLIGRSINDILGQTRLGYHDVYVQTLCKKVCRFVVVSNTIFKSNSSTIDTLSSTKHVAMIGISVQIVLPPEPASRVQCIFSFKKKIWILD